MDVLGLFSLAGNSIVVTGAGSGLGKAMAEACAEAGAAVVCSGRSDAVDATAAEIAERGGTAVAVRADVTDENAVEVLLDSAVAAFGSVDVVFCNAGTSDFYRRVDETSLHEWNQVVAADLTSVFLCAKHAVKRMAPRKRGKIITIASVWGQIASNAVPVPAYAAAKGGVINLTRELALECYPLGITVNALSPGFFSTNIGTDKEAPPGAIELLVENAVKRTPIGRFMHTDEIKGPAVFLASAASDAINGHVLTVDGGLVAC
jgi:gluconate 5-dehydrogenase